MTNINVQLCSIKDAPPPPPPLLYHLSEPGQAEHEEIRQIRRWRQAATAGVVIVCGCSTAAAWFRYGCSHICIFFGGLNAVTGVPLTLRFRERSFCCSRPQRRPFPQAGLENTSSNIQTCDLIVFLTCCSQASKRDSTTRRKAIGSLLQQLQAIVDGGGVGVVVITV
jgi:hypothetical protein